MNRFFMTKKTIVRNACDMYGVDEDNVLLHCYVRMYLMHVDGVRYPPSPADFGKYTDLAMKVVKGVRSPWTFPGKEA